MLAYVVISISTSILMALLAVFCGLSMGLVFLSFLLGGPVSFMFVVLAYFLVFRRRREFVSGGSGREVSAEPSPSLPD